MRTKENSSEISFKEVPVLCKCGYLFKEIVISFNNVALLDVECPSCKRRNLELLSFENEESNKKS